MGAVPKHGARKKKLETIAKPRARGKCCTANLPDYEDDETEFFMAMDRYKREKRRPFPMLSELLEVLKSLGWRKVKP